MTHVRTDANHDTLNCAHQLIACGHEEAAVQVYLNLSPRDDTPDAAQSGARAIVRTMVLNNTVGSRIVNAVCQCVFFKLVFFKFYSGLRVTR